MRALAAVVLVLTLLAGCATTDDDTVATTKVTGTGFQSRHQGGTLRLVANASFGTADPQVSYTNQSWSLFETAYDGLVAFKKASGSASLTIVPDLATALPTVTDGGLTYTFHLRSGIRFSDGSALGVDDVVASFQRIFRVSSPTAGTFYAGIVGADKCVETPANCTLPQGIIGDAKTGTVTIHLTAADPDFLYELAVPHASILPSSTLDEDLGSTPVPGTGAYRIASYDSNREIRLVRNPYFKEWSADAQPQGYPDAIVESFGLTVEGEVTAVENGQADWVYDPLPTDRLGEIGSNYASQVNTNDMNALWYLSLNVNIAPFNNLNARQALNYAVDRSALVRLFGGHNMASPACTVLPPGIPGHENYCQYTSGTKTSWSAPDLAKAKALVKASGTAGQTVGIVVANDDVDNAIGQYLQTVLTELGYKAVLKPMSGAIQFTYIQNSNNRVQIGLTQWYQDYPSPADFLQVLLSCASFTPGSDSSINMSGFCDKKLDARMATARTTQLTDTKAAMTQWGTIDRDMMAQAPVVPLFTPKQVDFTSARVGNYTFSRMFTMLFAKAWVR